MEPLKIDYLGLENNAGNIRIKGAFTNVVSAGASNFTVKEIRSDLNVKALFVYSCNISSFANFLRNFA